MLGQRFGKAIPCKDCNLLRKACKDCGKCSEHCLCAVPLMLTELLLNVEGFYDVQLQADDGMAVAPDTESFALVVRHRKSGQSVTLSGLELEQLESVALVVSKQRAAGDLRRDVTEENLRSLPVQSLKYVLRELPVERLHEIERIVGECLRRQGV
jgi:hypothetical protein